MSKINKSFSLEVFFIIAIAIACILRIINLDSREFWYDEVLSLLLSTGQKKLYFHPPDFPIALANYRPLLTLPLENSLGDMIQTGDKLLKGLVAEPHPPLFFIEQHLGLRLWGNSAATMRIFPAFYSLGSLLCAYGIGRKLLTHRAGLFFAAALGLNPFLLFHSLNVRMYSGLLFWAILSGWATLELFYNSYSKNYYTPTNLEITDKNVASRLSLPQKIFWSLILVASVTAGIMTFYYFTIWVASLGIFVVLLDLIEAKKIAQAKDKKLKNNLIDTLLVTFKSRRWQYQSILLTSGFVITIPWLMWGTRQQLNNADLGRFKAGDNLFVTAWTHIQGILTTLGINLLTGDWANQLTPSTINIAGLIAIALTIVSISYLWRKKQHQILLTAVCWSILPLSIMVAIDVVSGKFTVGFGFGRSLIFILPGYLLLWIAAICQTRLKWQTTIAIVLLSCYFITSVADFSLRPRSMFSDVAQIVNQKPNTPTLIAMDSSAWGHVLRLAYYLPSDSPLDLLAQSTGKLNTALANTFEKQPEAYQRIILLNSDRPVWNPPITQQQQQEINNTITQKFSPTKQEKLTGTWELDNFTLSVYEK